MAPEQLAGNEVTARSDIYALGLVLYEIFTGQRALEGKNLAELIRKREQSGITAADRRSSKASIRRSSARSCAASSPIRRTPGVGARGRRRAAGRRSARGGARRRRNAVTRNGGCRCEPGSAVDARDDRVCRRHHPRAGGHRRPLPAGHPAQPGADAEAAGSAGGSGQGCARRAWRQPVRDRLQRVGRRPVVPTMHGSSRRRPPRPIAGSCLRTVRPDDVLLLVSNEPPAACAVGTGEPDRPCKPTVDDRRNDARRG